MSHFMITANLIVSFPFDKNEDGNPREEEWGGIGLPAAPVTGDLIHVWHDHDYQIVRVNQVLHNAILHPLPDDELAGIRRKVPYLDIQAEWVTIDLTSYKNW